MPSRIPTLGLAAFAAGCGAHSPPVPQHPALPQPTPPTPALAVGAPASSAVLPASTVEAPLGASWGTAHAVSLVAASPDRRWVALCQARIDTNGDGHVQVELGAQGELRGDRLEGYFVDEPGSGVRIDAFGGADPSGRFVAFVANDRLVLRDTLTRTDTNLGEDLVDLRDDRGSFSHPRAVSFDPTGRRLLYLRKNGTTDDIVVRELATGAEAIVTPPAGELWRADFDATGESIIVRVVARDTNGNGHLDWPVPQSLGSWMRCATPLPRYAAWERPGDEASAMVAPSSGGPAVDAPGLVVPFGDAFVERDAEGALVIAKPSGQRTTVAKKSCAAKLLHADPGLGLLVTTCEGKKGRSDVRFIVRGADKSLGLELLAPAGDHWAPPGSTLLPLYPGSDTVLLDLPSGDATRLTPGDRVIVTVADHALILRGRSLVLYAKGAAERILEPSVDPLAHVLRSGTVVTVPPVVVDVSKGEVLGRVDGRALAVARDGAALVPLGNSADSTRLATGPLVWQASDQRGNVSAASSRAPEASAVPPSVLPMATPPAK